MAVKEQRAKGHSRLLWPLAVVSREAPIAGSSAPQSRLLIGSCHVRFSADIHGWVDWRNLLSRIPFLAPLVSVLLVEV